jgi:hypothetical protein
VGAKVALAQMVVALVLALSALRAPLRNQEGEVTIMSIDFRSQGIGKVVNITFPSETRASCLGGILSINLCVIAARNGKVVTFIWSEGLNHVVVENELQKMVEKHSAHISFSDS